MDNFDFSTFRKQDTKFISPYTSIDVDIIKDVVPEYIYLDADQNTQDRGRLAKSFSNIGCVYVTGSLLGGLIGFSNGIREINHKDSLWKTKILNHVIKKSCWYGLPLGVLATMYSVFAFGFNKIRGGKEDEWNTLAGTTLSGAVYKGSNGLHNAARGAVVGFMFGSLIVLIPMCYNQFDEKNKYNI